MGGIYHDYTPHRCSLFIVHEKPKKLDKRVKSWYNKENHTKGVKGYQWGKKFK